MECAIFQSSSRDCGYPGYRDRSGQQVAIMRPLREDGCDKNEVGAMFRVRFDDGVEADAFADELKPTT